jgi:hypothetical protein
MGSLFTLLVLAEFVACGETTDGNGVPDRCRLPAESGPCLAYGPSYYHDLKTGLCTPFVYGGCNGNDNRFPTQEACLAACDGGTPNFDVCSSPADCVLASPGCCAACDPVDRTAVVALNGRYLADYTSIIGCAGVACAPCPEVSEEQKSRQNFVATCQLGRCIAIDIRTTDVTKCQSATDCSLRDGADCCEGCDGTGIVSIASLDDLRSLTCGDMPTCPGCVTRIPPDLVPGCEDGRCAVARQPLPN